MSEERRQVECIAAFDGKGGLKPIRVRFEDDEGQHVINVDKIIEQDTKTAFGSMNSNRAKAYHFKCLSNVDGVAVPYKLMFDTNSCKWAMI